MTSPYLDLVRAHAALLATPLPLISSLKGMDRPPKPAIAANAPVVLLCSPHPDDECITGALPLRFMRQNGWRVINIPITLGSNPRRQEERWVELQHACDWLGFELQEIEPGGLSHVTASCRERDPEEWESKQELLAEIIKQYKPTLVVCPNSDDGHATHIGTHHLVLDALAHEAHACWLLQTEFWRAMTHPNLLIESSENDVADLIGALSCHVGEVKRNPYHLRFTSWLADNVRRGAEIVSGAGMAAPNFCFGTLYRLDHFDGEQIQPNKLRRILGAHEDPLQLIS